MFNPSIDYVVRLDELTPGAINRAVNEHMHIGGKGLNVSCMLNELGAESVALGFIGGFTGRAIADELGVRGIAHELIDLPGELSRINVKICGMEETEINGAGPNIPLEALKQLLKRLDALADGDTLVLSGSVQNSISLGIYAQLLERVSGKDVLTIVDAEAPLLLPALQFKPFLIKPNVKELAEMVCAEVSTFEQISSAAAKLQQFGAQNVLVSMGEDGAALFTRDGEVLRQSAFSGTVYNSVGAGDSMIAGFLAAYLGTRDFDAALRLGSAAGAATAFSPGIATGTLVNEILNSSR
jgi:1-phosphofructokinase